MADELTINYEFVQPELAIPGWGPKLNSTIAQIDAEIRLRELASEANEAAIQSNELAVLALDSALQDLSGVSDPVAARQNLGVVGKQTIWVQAISMVPTVANGSGFHVNIETVADRPDIIITDFAAGVDQFAQFQIAFLKQWNKGTVSAQFFWTGDDASAGDVVWGIQAVAVSDDELISAAYGAAQSIVDGFGGTLNDLMVSAESAAVTIAGVPADADMCFFRISRNGADIADTYAGKARLLGVKLFFTNNTGNDA